MAASTPEPVPRRSRSQPIVVPLLLIGLGVVLLLNNLGYLPWYVWSAIWQFWPVALILLGLEVLITRRVPWGVLVLAVVLVVVASLGGWFGRGPVHRPPGVPPVPAATNHQELADASRAVISLRMGAGRMRLHPIDSSTDLAQWTIEGDVGRINRSYHVRDGTGRLELLFRGGPGFPPFQRDEIGRSSLDLGLRRDVPLEIRAGLGASSAELDLTDLSVSELQLDAGASQGTVHFPAGANTTATIRGGASTLTLVVPDGVGSRIVSTGGLSSVHLDTSRYIALPRDLTTIEYRSTDYETAAHRLDLTLTLGAASVEVR